MNMKKYKIYGNEKTHLTLTDKAQSFYNLTDPFGILEYEDEEGNYTYSTIKCFERDNMTEDELNIFLEELAEDMEENSEIF